MKNKTIIESAEEIVSSATGIGIDAIKSSTRKQEVCDARHALWYLLNKKYGYSQAGIGRYYGRCHTTVMDGINKIKKRGVLAEILKEIRKIKNLH